MCGLAMVDSTGEEEQRKRECINRRKAQEESATKITVMLTGIGCGCKNVLAGLPTVYQITFLIRLDSLKNLTTM